MWGRHLRRTAALTTTAIAVTLAAPAIEAATATTPTVPVLPDLSSLPVSNMSTIISELQALQATAPGGSLPAGSLGTLETTLGTLVGGTLSTTLQALNLVLGSNPAAPAYLTGLLTDLENAGATGTTAAALQEIEAALTTAGLGQLLTQVPGLTPSQIDTILQELAALQSLPLGASVPAGGMSSLGALLSAIAGQGGVSGTAAATSLNQAAGSLSGGAVSATQLEAVIGELQSADGSLPAPLGGRNGVLSALASQLADASSLFGGLGSLGSPPSAPTVLGALGALQQLPALPSGGNLAGGGGMAQVASILATVAGEPGVPSPVASTLNGAAATLANPSASLNPVQLSQLISALQGAGAALPAPLGGSGGVVPSIAAALAGAGTLVGGGTTTTSGGSTGTTGGSTGTVPTTSSGTSSSRGSTSPTSSPRQPGATAHAGYIRVTRVRRAGQRVTLLLTCTASRGRRCTGTVAASEAGYAAQGRRLTLAGGARRTVTVALRTRRGHQARGRTRRRPAIHVVVRSGRYRFSRTLR